MKCCKSTCSRLELLEMTEYIGTLIYFKPRVEAWYYNPSQEDNRLPHQYKPNRPVPSEHLDELGVLIWNLDAGNWENNPELEKIKEERGYNYSDVVTVAPGKMPDYEEKIKYFFTEHLHAEEEIRFVLEGGGYFDIRDYDEQWIRFRINKGHLIVLPAGMYHRFTLDANNYVKAMRMFKGLPCWTQHQRPADDMDARKTYVEKVLKVGSISERGPIVTPQWTSASYTP